MSEITPAPKQRTPRRKPGQFATDTSVPVYKTKMEIESLIQRAGGTRYSTHDGGDFAAIAFELGVRRILIKLPLPSRRDFDHVRVNQSKYATAYDPDGTERRWEQGCRSRWRALFLVLKAKLEAITVGIATMEDEFLAYTMLPNQQTVGDWANPQVDEVYRTGEMPPMMPGLSTTSPLRAISGGKDH